MVGIAGAIRLVADPRNALFAENYHGDMACKTYGGRACNGKSYRRPGIINLDGLYTREDDGLEDAMQKLWVNTNGEYMLWRLGSDGTISLPSGLYLTAMKSGYLGLHSSCAAGIAPAFDTSTWQDPEFGAGTCCHRSSAKLVEEVEAYCADDTRFTALDAPVCDWVTRFSTPAFEWDDMKVPTHPRLAAVTHGMGPKPSTGPER